MDFRILIVLCVVSFLFIFFPNRFRHHFENWILSKEPKPYALNQVVFYVLYFGYLGWTGYSVYKDINFIEYFPLTLLLLLYLTDKKDKPNRTDYFKNKQQQQKEWIEKSM